MDNELEKKMEASQEYSIVQESCDDVTQHGYIHVILLTLTFPSLSSTIFSNLRSR